MNVRGSRVGNYPPRWNAAPSQELLVIRPNGVANLHFAILDRVGRKYPSFIPADPGLDPAAIPAQLGSLGRDDSPEGFPVKRYNVRAAGWADLSQRLRRYRR